MEIYDNERIDDLHRDNLLIIQNPEKFCFGCDAVLLSYFVKIKKNEIALDLGTGTGIIPILLTAKTNGKFFYGLEIQEGPAQMAQRSVDLNNLRDKIEIKCGDLKLACDIYKKSFFDVITVNPPYIVTDGGLKNNFEAKAVARHEVLCTLEDVISVSSKLLKPNGRFYMVHRPHRLTDIITLMAGYKLGAKTIQFVYPKIDKGPTMVLVEAVRGAKPMLNVLKPLIIYGADGRYTDEINDIYYGGC